MTFRRTLLAATVAVVTLSASFAASAQNVVLKSSDTHPAGYPTVVAVENFGKKLDAATSGRLTVKMFPGAVLGEEKAVVEQVQIGAIQMARISLGVIGPIVPEVDVFNMHGQRIKTVVAREQLISGPHSRIVDLSNYANGTYVVNLRTQGSNQSVRMVKY